MATSITGIAPLPADLQSLNSTQRQRALDERELLADQVGEEMTGRDISAVTCLDGSDEAKVAQMKAMNDDIRRLRQFVQHPGFPTGHRRSGSDTSSGYGRMQGLGAEFLKELGKGRGGVQAALDGTSGGATMPVAFFDPKIRDLPQRQLFVRSLIPTRQVNSDKVDYIRQTVFTNNAAPVAAGALKPTSVLTAERVEAPIRVIAHISEAIDRSMLSDYDQLMSFIDNQLRLGVLLAEEDQILNGNGTPPNLDGLLHVSGTQTTAASGAGDPDAVMTAITKVRNSFYEPDGVVMHPNDWLDYATLRTADGVYIWGSPADAANPQMWGKPVITSPVIAEGTALVGAFGAGAEVYERDGARITWAETGLGDSAGQELFSRNQIRARGESRIGLAIIRPDAFCKVTGI